MKRIILLCATALAILSCTDTEGARKVLESQGFRNIEITGYNFFGCGKDDAVHTGFSATGLDGNPIEGTVCSGLIFKGSTVRY